MKIKGIIVALVLLVITSNNLLAHYLWIETNTEGKIGKEQLVKVFFGEYAYGLKEIVGKDKFDAVNKFKVWAISPDGSKEELLFVSKDTLSYQSSFIPKQSGTYTLLLNNNEIDVIDYTKYDFGIFKTHYHSLAKIVVKGDFQETVIQNPEGLSIKDLTTEELRKGGEVKLQVLFKGEPIKSTELSLFIEDQWGKKLYTNEEGVVSTTLPWSKQYLAEVTFNEEVPGTYKGEDYEFIFHSVTYSIDLSK